MKKKEKLVFSNTEQVKPTETIITKSTTTPKRSKLPTKQSKLKQPQTPKSDEHPDKENIENFAQPIKAETEVIEPIGTEIAEQIIEQAIETEAETDIAEDVVPSTPSVKRGAQSDYDE